MPGRDRLRAAAGRAQDGDLSRLEFLDDQAARLLFAPFEAHAILALAASPFTRRLLGKRLDPARVELVDSPAELARVAHRELLVLSGTVEQETARRQVELLLARLGISSPRWLARVRIYHDPAALLRRAAAAPPDLVLVDPGRGAEQARQADELVARLRRAERPTPVVRVVSKRG